MGVVERGWARPVHPVREVGGTPVLVRDDASGGDDVATPAGPMVVWLRCEDGEAPRYQQVLPQQGRVDQLVPWGGSLVAVGVEQGCWTLSRVDATAGVLWSTAFEGLVSALELPVVLELTGKGAELVELDLESGAVVSRAATGVPARLLAGGTVGVLRAVGPRAGLYIEGSRVPGTEAGVGELSAGHGLVLATLESASRDRVDLAVVRDGAVRWVIERSGDMGQVTEDRVFAFTSDGDVETLTAFDHAGGEIWRADWTCNPDFLVRFGPELVVGDWEAIRIVDPCDGRVLQVVDPGDGTVGTGVGVGPSGLAVGGRSHVALWARA